MDYKNITREVIEEAVKNTFYSDNFNSEPRRQLTIQTGPYGYDSFSEAMETKMTGTKRVYLGFKIMRIMRKAFKVHYSSATKRYFKRIKT